MNDELANKAADAQMFAFGNYINAAQDILVEFTASKPV